MYKCQEKKLTTYYKKLTRKHFFIFFSFQEKEFKNSREWLVW